MASFLHEALAWPRRRARQGAISDNCFETGADIALFGWDASSLRTSRSLTVAAGAEADQLTLAFLRYIELHGRTLVGPRSRCSVTTVRGEGTETKILTFWSRRAAAGFDLFWRRYRAVYGAPGDRPG
jgi:hypothetical protein